MGVTRSPPSPLCETQSMPLLRLRALAAACGAALALCSGGVRAATYVDAVVGTARAERLAGDVTWLRLGHYRPATFGGYTSEADGRPFFLATEGKHDPEAELEATLRAFFTDPPRAAGAQHPICQFPARFLWLRARLALDPRELPRPDCPELADFLRRLAPESVTLVFSSYYMNNPASSFGHTFLRVNRRADRSGGHDELLDHGVDYSATVDTGNAFLYAVKGLLGLFPGTFRSVPYYLKVREYNDYESRDLWEYDLSLSAAEMQLFSLHLWELGSTYFAYYYLSENCSYHVLSALEVASPRLELTSPLRWPVLPADTVKVLFRTPGLVRRLHYRPSAETTFRGRLRELTDAERGALGALIADPAAPFPADFSASERARVLDAALDLADSRFARELVKDEATRDRDAAEYKQDLLVRRAEEATVSEDFTLAPPFRRMPHLAHGSRRVSLGSGWSSAGGYYHALSGRLALHDLGDPPRGFPETAQIEFVPFSVRYHAERPRLTLEDVSLVRVLSLSPWDRFAQGLSFKIDVGADRVRDGGCSDCLAGQVNLAGGLATSLFEDGVMAYTLAAGHLAGLAPLRGGIADLPLRAGVGPLGGLRLRLHDDLVAHGEAQWLYLPAQSPDRTWSVKASLRYQYVRDFAFGIDGRHQPGAHAIQASSYLYF